MENRTPPERTATQVLAVWETHAPAQVTSSLHYPETTRRAQGGYDMGYKRILGGKGGVRPRYLRRRGPWRQILVQPQLQPQGSAPVYRVDTGVLATEVEYHLEANRITTH